MKIIILFFLIFVETIIAKPTIGIVKLNIKSKNLKVQAEQISEYIKLSSGLLESDYKIINSTMDLDELMLVTGCESFNKRCKYDIADSMKVDYLLYGTIENVPNKIKLYKLTLSKLTIIDRKIINKTLLSVKNNKDYVSKIDTLLKQFFPKDIFEKNETNKLLEIKTFVKNKAFSSKVYLDKKYIGKTPIILKNDKYLTGKHTIILKAKGYDTIKREIFLKDGETQILSINMFLVNNPAKKNIIKDINNKNIRPIKKDEAWYKNWKVQTGAGIVVVAIITTVTIILLSGNKTPKGSKIYVPLP